MSALKYWSCEKQIQLVEDIEYMFNDLQKTVIKLGKINESVREQFGNFKSNLADSAVQPCMTIKTTLERLRKDNGLYIHPEDCQPLLEARKTPRKPVKKATRNKQRMPCDGCGSYKDVQPVNLCVKCRELATC